MSSINKYFQELKRRHVFKSIGFYLVAAFVIMQVTVIIAPTLMLPEWTTRLILILLILGFPIAVIFAWIYDRSPEGFIKTDHISPDQHTITEDGLPKDENGNSAIVYIDILDYSKLMNQDEKKAIDLVHYKHKIILPFIEKYGGLLINRLGDGTLCIFSDSAKAVCFSLEILQMWKRISPTRLKVGIHLDNVVFEQGDILGKGINCTFRINSLAKSGEIYISKPVNGQVQSRPDIHTTSMGNMNLEGFTETYELFSVNIPEQFVAMDEDLNMSSVQPMPENKVNYSSLIGWIGGILVTIFILFQGINFFSKPKIIGITNSIAVFPFDNILDNNDFEWLSDGFARTLTYKLSEVEKLNVIDQLQILKTIEKVQPQEAGIAYDVLTRKTAEQMDINLLLSGSYQIYEKQIQITAQLVNVETGVVKPLLMETYPLSEPLKMQADVANKITTLINNNTLKQ